MRWTQSLIATLRDKPADAEAVSHVLMLRAGLIRQLSAGVYSYLPLGLRALRKAEAIVREEMNRAGAVELLMPVLHPAELWQETGRFEGYGPALFKFEDRRGGTSVLGPTHEEVVTHLVRGEVRSYRQLPVTLYQIQTKFRDEIRVRFGVIRSREFLMKDAYSFDADEAGMDASYQKQYDAYVRIFRRAGLDAVAVEAESGLIGGSFSHEFMVPSPMGEDIMARCAACGYAANLERVACKPVPGAMGRETREMERMNEVSTPGAKSVEEVCAFLHSSPSHLIKTLIMTAAGDPIAVLIRGDHEVNLAKLARAVGKDALEMANEATIERVTGGPRGFSGPVGLTCPVYMDATLEGGFNYIAGANKADTHVRGANIGRDFQATKVADLRFGVEGDPCPKCSRPIAFTPSIEVGHVFKLGTKYSAKMKAEYTDEKGKAHPIVMGCYGIGVNRIVAAAIESHHDEAGIVWPRAIAPFSVEVVSIGDGPAESVVADLEAAGLDVLWDDRDLSPGVKFTDADLLGMPVRVTVGKRTVKSGTVDLATRHDRKQDAVPVGEVVERVKAALGAYPF